MSDVAIPQSDAAVMVRSAREPSVILADDTLDCQASATHSSKKASAGDFQPNTFLGRLLIRLTT